MIKFAGAVLLGTALLAPVTVSTLRAEDEHHKYYDRDHRDYHEWNESENRAWHRYWSEQHRDAVEWQRAKTAQQRAYWRWRHEHPDAR